MQPNSSDTARSQSSTLQQAGEDASAEPGFAAIDTTKSQAPAAQKERAPATPPNGGLTAWLQVLGCHFLFFNSWGIVNTFGAYQVFYSTHYLTSSSASAVSWVGTTQGFLMICVGVITGPLYDMGYLHYLIYIGTFLNVFGLMMTSLSTTYYEVFLSFGVCVGLGSACLFVPSVAIVATWFTTRRSAATGLAAAGGSLGGLIYPIVFRKLEVHIGYGWATRVIGFISFGTLIVSAIVLKPRILPPKKRALLDKTAFKDLPYIMFSLSLFFIFIGLYIPFFYMPLYATEKLHTSESLGFYLLAILNAASIFGRIIPNIMADKYGSLNVLIPFILVAGGLIFAWIGIHNLAGVIVFCILFGFFSGSIVSLPPTALVTLSPDLSVIGTRMGMCFSFAGLGLLIGNPIAGAILAGRSGFTGLKAFSAATVIAGFVCMVMAWLKHKMEVARRAAVEEK